MAGYVGVDVAAHSVEMAHLEAGQIRLRKQYAQTPSGHQALVAELQRLKPHRVVLEATGIYYFDLAVALEAAGLPVSVINPKSFHHFAQLKLQQSKSDPIDSALLADYGQCLQPPLWAAPQPSRLALRDIGRQINRLTATRTQAKNRLHALHARRGTPVLLIEDETEAIAALDRRIERLTRAAEQLLADNPALAEQARHLQAAKGIAAASAIALLAELCVLPAHLRAPQVSRYAGLDVRLYQSGSSVQRAGRISKAGNAYLRAALYMPALSAVRFDPHARAFYDRLLARGKKKRQALCAVMRKYLTGLWACIQANEPFDAAKLFSDSHMKTA